MMPRPDKLKEYRAFAAGLSLMVAFFFFVSACHREAPHQYQKTVDGVTLTMSSSKGPFIKGINDVTVRVMDGSGKAVSNARIEVRYFTNPFNGRPSIDVSAPAVPKGETYGLIADLPSAGEWNAEILVRSPELKNPHIVAAFKIEVVD